jgi:hypothetical protein
MHGIEISYYSKNAKIRSKDRILAFLLRGRDTLRVLADIGHVTVKVVAVGSVKNAVIVIPELQGYRGHGDTLLNLLMRQSHLFLQDILLNGYSHVLFEAVNQGGLGAACMGHDVGQSDFFVNMIVNITQDILDLTIGHFGVQRGSTFFDVLVKHQIHEALDVRLVVEVVGGGSPTAEILQLQGPIAFENDDVLRGLTEGFL